ncbi:MAG: hypothetical protein ACFHHU_01305 [Porticoccaceae bacterium]
MKKVCDVSIEDVLVSFYVGCSPLVIQGFFSANELPPQPYKTMA